jgi:hypothetical protein
LFIERLDALLATPDASESREGRHASILERSRAANTLGLSTDYADYTEASGDERL